MDGTEGGGTGPKDAPPRRRRAAKAQGTGQGDSPSKPAAKPRRPSAKTLAAQAADAARWSRYALWMLAGLTVLRLALNAVTVIPVHFDEAQYWAYGNELALGHYSKPPLVGWVIEATTRLFGDTLFGLRVGAPLAHLAVGALIFLTARRLFDARTGFFAAALYSAAPGVNVSALLMTTDPVMMAGWALALYALVRALERPQAAHWWALCGLGVGLGMLAKYTAVAFPLGLLGYALLSREGPLTPQARRGAWIAAAAALAAVSPNLVWNAANGFVTVAHLGESGPDAGGGLRPGKLAEFLGAQLAVFGPVALAALAAAAAGLIRRAERADWRLRLLWWLTLPLIAAMCVQALRAGANPNWAAPAYVAGAILGARWLTARDWTGALRLHAALGAAALAGVLALGTAYLHWTADLPRLYDPFKKMRLGGPFCEVALSAMEAEGAEALLSNDRRRLSECQFLGGLRFEDVAVFSPDPRPRNHVEFRSRLQPGDRRLMILAVESDVEAERIAAHFFGAQPIGVGRLPIHADRDLGYALWLVEGFEGY